MKLIKQIDSDFQFLTVRQCIEPIEWEEIGRVVSCWSVFAKEMKSREPGKKTVSYKKLSDCKKICESIHSLLKRKDLSTLPIEMHICEAKNAIRGVLLLEIYDSVDVIAIVTDPANLISPSLRQSKDSAPISGVGRELMQTAIKKAIQLEKKSVCLDAVPSAIGFYKKLGFELDGEEDQEPLAPSMILTMEKIYGLYAHLILPQF